MKISNQMLNSSSLGCCEQVVNQSNQRGFGGKLKEFYQAWTHWSKLYYGSLGRLTRY